MRVPIDAVVRALLVDAIDLAIEEAADLKCKSNMNDYTQIPLLPKLQQLTSLARSPSAGGGTARSQATQK